MAVGGAIRISALSHDENEWAFLTATRFFDERHGDTATQGMTDKQLAEALRDSLQRRLIWGCPYQKSYPLGLDRLMDCATIRRQCLIS